MLYSPNLQVDKNKTTVITSGEEIINYSAMVAENTNDKTTHNDTSNKEEEEEKEIKETSSKPIRVTILGQTIHGPTHYTESEMANTTYSKRNSNNNANIMDLCMETYNCNGVHTCDRPVILN